MTCAFGDFGKATAPKNSSKSIEEEMSKGHSLIRAVITSFTAMTVFVVSVVAVNMIHCDGVSRDLAVASIQSAQELRQLLGSAFLRQKVDRAGTESLPLGQQAIIQAMQGPMLFL